MQQRSKGNIEFQKLAELVEILSGLTNISSENKGQPVRLINIRDIEGGFIKPEPASEIYIQDTSKFERYRVQVGDVLLSTRGTVTKVAIVDKASKGAIFSSNLALLRVKDSSRLKPSLLKAYFESQAGQKTLQSMAKGNVILHITIKRLRELEIPVPPLSSQEHLEKLLSHFNKYKQTTLSTLERSERLTQNLVEKLFADGRLLA